MKELCKRLANPGPGQVLECQLPDMDIHSPFPVFCAFFSFLLPLEQVWAMGGPYTRSPLSGLGLDTVI